MLRSLFDQWDVKMIYEMNQTSTNQNESYPMFHTNANLIFQVGSKNGHYFTPSVLFLVVNMLRNFKNGTSSICNL